MAATLFTLSELADLLYYFVFANIDKRSMGKAH